MVGLLGVACGDLVDTLGRGPPVWGHLDNLGDGWGRCDCTLGGGVCANGMGLGEAEAGSIHC